jgi:hypothetical protein
MSCEGLPDWVPAWCADRLGGEPFGVLFELRSMSAVFGPRLADGRDVVVKAREDGGRAASCVAARARERLSAADLPCVLGHADFEAQNLRWRGERVWAVHDWDSLAWQPEAALAGAACGTFAGTGPPTLAPIESSAAFLAVYQELRGRRFTAEEHEVAWAASLWPAAHNARWEAVHGSPPVCGEAVRAKAAERLRRTGA